MSRKRYHSSDMGLDPKYARQLIAQGKYFAAVLYERAIDHADDWGRMNGEIGQFILAVLPTCPESDEAVEQALRDIEDAGLWERYEIEGRWYIQFPIAAWLKYQTYINAEKQETDFSEFPPPPEFPLPRRERRQGRRSDLDELQLTSVPQKLTEVTSVPQKSLQLTSAHFSVPSPSPSPSPSEEDAVLSELDALKGVPRTDGTRRSICKTLADLPHLDPIEVAVEYVRWQETVSPSRRHRDVVGGWRNQMKMRRDETRFFRSQTRRSKEHGIRLVPDDAAAISLVDRIYAQEALNNAKAN